MSSLNKSQINKYDSISTWDFSTLYTTIPHSDLVTRITKLVQLTFSKNEGKIMLVNERNCYFSYDEDKSGYLSVSCKQFCELFNYLISNIFVKLGDDIFRQIVGIFSLY